MLFIRNDNCHSMTYDIQNLSPASTVTACVTVIIISLIYTVKKFLWNCLQIVNYQPLKCIFWHLFSGKNRQTEVEKRQKYFLFLWLDVTKLWWLKLFSKSWDKDEQNGK